MSNSLRHTVSIGEVYYQIEFKAKYRSESQTLKIFRKRQITK